jgi:hypothetical protein
MSGRHVPGVILSDYIEGIIDPRVDNGTFCTKIEYA